jgi:hypothetical protein
LAVTVAFIQALNKIFWSLSQIGMGFSIGTETPSKSLKFRREIHERLKVGERFASARFFTLAQNGLVCLAMPLQKPFIVLST